MNSRSLGRSIALLAWVVLSTFPTAVLSQDLISLNAFGDINYGFQFGDPASSRDAEEFEAFGEERFTKSSHRGFGLVGTDFVLTGELPADMVYLGEVNLQVARGAQTEFEVDVERMFLEKRFVQQFNVLAGLFFTPIGYFNRTLYSRAYLMNSVQIPDLFEEELGLVPTHTVGLQAYGETGLGGDHRLGYAVSLGNGRAADPVNNVYARDDDGWRSLTAMAEWWFPWFNEGRLGVSAWYDRIKTYRINQLGEVRNVFDPTTETLKLHEVGLDAYLVIKSTWVNVMVEGVYQQHSDRGDTLPANVATTKLTGSIAEVALNLGEQHNFKPYVRHDWTHMPRRGDPYLGLRLDGDEATRVYVLNTNLLMTGLAWDMAAACRLKLEYSVALTGARDRHAIVAQSAFAF